VQPGLGIEPVEGLVDGSGETFRRISGIGSGRGEEEGLLVGGSEAAKAAAEFLAHTCAHLRAVFELGIRARPRFCSAIGAVYGAELRIRPN
jgi:hypothetical protein